MNAISMSAALLVLAAGFFGCGSDNPPPPLEQAGQPCTAAAQCYPTTDGAALMGGPPVCLDQVSGGYCTHICAADTDCCAVPGECRTSFPEVCSPFESAPDKYCILSCETAVLGDAGFADGDAFCATHAHAGFSCRSSGGGASNRKVCVP